MAQFSVEFERNQNTAPTYEDYSIVQSTQCNDDGFQRRVSFNDIINGDFIVGYNYNSPSGYSAQTIRILSYSDTMTFTEVANGNVTVPPGFIPSRLRTISNNTVLTYPYSMNIASLSDIELEINSSELICDGGKYVSKRERVIQYIIFDSNGQPGPTKEAKFTNSQA